MCKSGGQDDKSGLGEIRGGYPQDGAACGRLSGFWEIESDNYGYGQRCGGYRN